MRLKRATSLMVLALLVPVPAFASTQNSPEWLVLPRTDNGSVTLNVAPEGRHFNPKSLRVFVEGQESDRAISGRIAYAEHSIQFQPSFPFQKGTDYRVEVETDCFWSQVCTGRNIVTATFQIRPSEEFNRSELLTVEPGAEVVPANVLRFYLYFSKPMAQGDVYRNISLFDENGAQIYSPFLNLPRGLWDASQTRLTILLDPGRLKTGVEPNLRNGPPLQPEGHYRLKVSRDLRDADGNRLGRGYNWSFSTSEAVKQRVDLNTWTFETPVNGSNQPLTVRTLVLLDAVNAFRRLLVVNDRGLRVNGRFRIEKSPAGWSFIPSSPWQSGRYRVVVDTTIEDVSGNSAQTAFEIRAGQANALRPLRETLTFEVE
ncbi:hypothetical protein B0E33_18765 [Roseibium algicola]|uniref:Ig-like domain-containing protein n=1 Tax=Roseibium algicola TaxID=2857014 RepID=A0ABM6I4M6_9HYPH|nr:hypothetical protein [Roseibium aggregatum]AQQ05369.1 hypothetical protein B0E33_18765 [Roseibium aggregatum]